MEMLNAVADVLGYDTSIHVSMDRVRRIAANVPLKPGTIGFEEAVEREEARINEIGARAFGSMFAGFCEAQVPKEREYKIKRVAKGQRIKVVSASGVRFSFGEVWCNSVKAGKGIAVNELHREKLNMHGTHLGVQSPESMSARDLCLAIVANM